MTETEQQLTYPVKAPAITPRIEDHPAWAAARASGYSLHMLEPLRDGSGNPYLGRNHKFRRPLPGDLPEPMLNRACAAHDAALRWEVQIAEREREEAEIKLYQERMKEK